MRSHIACNIRRECHDPTDPTRAAGAALASRRAVSGPDCPDIAKDKDSIYYALTILLTVVVLAVNTWGLVALTMTALAMVPVIFVLLIAITQG